jgi:hypothetical protein
MRIFSSAPDSLIHVAVVETPGKRRPRLRAYTQWFAPHLLACWHNVHASSGAEAKKLAMAEHRAKCMSGR